MVEWRIVEERVPDCTGGWMHPCAGLDAAGERKISCLARNQTPSIQPKAYSLLTIPTELPWSYKNNSNTEINRRRLYNAKFCSGANILDQGTETP
jgi:hypothetical protein